MMGRDCGTKLCAVLALAVLIVSVPVYADQVTFATPDPASLQRFVMDSDPFGDPGDELVYDAPSDPGDVLLPDVPTSHWHFGCTATSAGMMFAYYDNYGYLDLYDQPTPDTLDNDMTIIASEAHQTDYWVQSGTTGPDPHEGNWEEHTWEGCPADFMGTNQWKWDYDEDGKRESNKDGATTLWMREDGEPLDDRIPPEKYGTPQTALTHGLRLFPESRGYNVLTNYTQRVDAVVQDGGFTFNDYMAEIDSGNPVMIQVTGHSMVGVGYNPTGETVYLHDTWGNYVADMTWGSTYDSRQMQAITVVHMDPSQQVPEPGVLVLVIVGVSAIGLRRRFGKSA